MIKILGDVILDNIELADVLDHSEVSKVLDALEEAGMLPPDRALCHPDMKYKDYTWEPENEEK